jgi:hypothetical protein
MRINVPRAIHIGIRGQYWDSYWRGSPKDLPRPTHKYVAEGVSIPADTIPIEVNNYFWDTHHRPMNDCVHSKLTGAEDMEIIPHGFVSINGSKYLYTRCLDHYGGECYVSDMDDSLIQNQICDRYVNDNYVSYGIMVTSHWQPRGQMLVTFQVNVHFRYCDVTRYAFPTVPYFSYSYEWTFGLDKSVVTVNHGIAMPTNLTSPIHSVSSSGGCKKVQAHMLSLMQEIAPQLYALSQGMSRYYKVRYPGDWTYFSSSSQGVYKHMIDLVYSKLQTIPAYGRADGWKDWPTSRYSAYSLVFPEQVPILDRFLFYEIDRIAGSTDPILLPREGLQGYWWNVLVQQAYLDALDSVPRLNDNSISNILEIAGFIKSLVIDHKIELPKSLGDVWLSYRYQYNTTKLDAEEAISFVHRHCELGTLDQWIHCFGASAVDFSNTRFSTRVSCRCGLEIRPSDVALLGKIWRALYTYGLQPNFYVVWDMIPYSFIIDWLIPIGNIAHAVDADRMYNGTYYEIKDVVFSISYDIVDEYANVYHQYTRWVQNDIPSLNGFYFFEEDPATTKVKGMRILDTLSLFIGRRK